MYDAYTVCFVAGNSRVQLDSGCAVIEKPEFQ